MSIATNFHDGLGACCPSQSGVNTFCGCGPVNILIPVSAAYTLTVTNPGCDPLVCPPEGWQNNWLFVDQGVFHTQDWGYVWEPATVFVDWGTL